MKIAAIQAAPVLFDTAATVEKTIQLMRRAASQGAQLCAFPESFLPGYPIWLSASGSTQWENPEQKKIYADYLGSAVLSDGPEIAAIVKEAKLLNIFTYLGVAERSLSGGALYCTLIAIHPFKGVASIHRKLMVTFHERLSWTMGDGNGLRVHDYEGFKVGGLNCWENWMPLARYSMYAQGENLHIAVWPGASFLTRDITRFLALEGRMYAMSVGGVLRRQDMPIDFPLTEDIFGEREMVLTGGSYIVGPNGETLAGPAEGDETILYADIDMTKVREERQSFDPAGHYNRPDIFNLTVSRKRLDPASFQE